MTRMPIIVLFVVATALIGETQPSNAQSVYSYPWCSLGDSKDSRSCYYASWEQCMTTMSGIGGNCIPSPYYHLPSTQLLRRALFIHHRLARTVRVNTLEWPAPHVTAAVADEPPKLDVTAPCNSTAQYALLVGRDKDTCLNDERMAETTLAQNWSKYSTGDKSQCIATVKTGGASSYVELLSCIEVLQDAKQIREGDPLMRSDQSVESAPQSVRRRRR